MRHRPSLQREPAPLVIAEAKTLPAELAFDDAILLDEVVDDVLLVAVDPAGDGDDEELPLVKGAPAGRW